MPEPAAAPPQPALWTILSPKWRGATARRGRGDAVGRFILFSLLGASFWAVLFGMTYRVLHYISSVEIGVLLAHKILDALLVGFASILLLSSLITSLSTFFLAKDLDILVSAPIDWFRLYLCKLVETAVHASWMVALLAVPIFTAYGIVFHGGALFPFVVLATLVPFFVLPAATGAAAMLVLVNVLPARRARDILGIIAIGASGGLIFLLRVIRPELLLQRGGMPEVVHSLASLSVPASPFLPTHWASDMIMNWLMKVADPLPVALLYTTAAAFIIMGGWLHGRLFRSGFSMAQEGGERFGGSAAWRRGVQRLLRPVPAARREFLLKDLRLFFRDPTQSGQLILLALLVAVYVFNIRALPIFSGAEVPLFIVTLIVFLNLGLAGFVLSAVAARFVFPAISLEGRQMWLLQSAPVSTDALFWSKYVMTTTPLIALAVVITVTTDLLLHASAFMVGISLGTIVLFTLATCAMALTFGAYYPQFESENAAQIPTSFGGLAFMLTAISLLGVVITVEAVPVASYLRARQLGVTAGLNGELVLALTAVTALCLGATAISLRLGLSRMRELEC
jgi:ABC-2 type transport system permease protein